MERNGQNMTYEKIFKDIQKQFKKAKIGAFNSEFAFQFNITGEGEGIFFAAYKNGKLSVEPFDYKDNDVIFTADGKTLTDIASGKLEPIDAINAGKLTVDGNQELAKQLMHLINSEKKTAKTASKTTAKTAAKPAAKKAAAKPAAKIETKAAAKPAAKTEKKTTAKTAAKTAAKTETKTAAKPATKAAAKAETKTAAKPAAKTATKTATKKTETKPAAKPAAKTTKK